MQKMMILRGIAGTFGGKYYPRGALDETSALEYARRMGYQGFVLDMAGATGSNSEQVQAAMHLLALDKSIKAIYGFSGGGYNVRHVLDQLNDVEIQQIELVVVIGAPNNPPELYNGPEDSWQLVYRTDPPEGHMAGPRKLLEELGPEHPTPISNPPPPPKSFWRSIWDAILGRGA